VIPQEGQKVGIAVPAGVGVLELVGVGDGVTGVFVGVLVGDGVTGVFVGVFEGV
jgi:hypothetical protein